VNDNDIDYDSLLSTVREIVAPIVSHVQTLRKQLVADERIQRFSNRDSGTDPATTSLAAADGGRIQEKLYLFDLIVARGTVANGKVSSTHPTPDPITWAIGLPRDKGTAYVAEAAMAAIELRLLCDSTHETRILDGSFITPLLGLREGIYARQRETRQATINILNGPWNPLTALNTVYTPDVNRPILALTKSDTSRLYSQTFTREGINLGGVQDRTLATQLLQPGEYLTPIPVDYSQIRTNRKSKYEPNVKTVGKEIDNVTETLIQHTNDNHIYTTYFKPYGSNHTVLKIDYFHTGSVEDNPVRRYVEIVNQDTQTPHILEPFSQWKADQLAKIIKKEPEKIKRNLLAQMTLEEKATFGPLILSNYRT